MNKKVISLLISISLNIYSQSELEQKPNKETLLINTLPPELKLHIAEKFLQSIVKENVVFNPFRGVKEGFKSLISIDKGFFNLRDEIKNDINKFIRKYFASDFINLSKEELNNKLKNILEGDYSELKEREAAKLIIAGADPNIMINFKNKTIPAFVKLLKEPSWNQLPYLLLDFKVDLDYQDKENNNILMLAIKNNKNVAEELIKIHINNINEINYDQKSALMIAIEKNNESIVDLLLTQKAQVNIIDLRMETPLIKAIEVGNRHMVESLISHGADINTAGKWGRTPLMYAILKGNLDIIKSLIRHKAEINAKDQFGDTVWSLNSNTRDPRTRRRILELLKDIDNRSTCLVS
ncbi:ankyrin repeat domain-containing protein [Candidatus Babela massiliensis]|uniref:Ankyrin repeats containing protein n=1 Tax=Candidatus Babela massiliensis TaxID=673862 RepID=V6DI59_9BACT|nr:ankyrin repeat domain-containing protein [Candidatus Babela massiliensis]CDK30216.1 Ankyrin repeats containing protein [Candidatus Babela massiliensis]